MRAASLLLFGLMIATGPLHAMAPPWQICDNADGTRSEFMTWDFQSEQTDTGMVQFIVDTQEDGTKVTYVVIVHCPTRQAVTWIDPENQNLADKINDEINSERKTTLRQLANRINRLGVKAQYGTLDAGNCACDKSSYYNSF